jgi:hypothetical protein
MVPVLLGVPLLAENPVGRTTPVALVVPLLREDLGLTAGHMVRVGHMVARPSRKDRTANQISTTKANQISTTRRGSAGRRGLLGLRWLSGQPRCAVAFL